jgi:hypothetical protein
MANRENLQIVETAVVILENTAVVHTFGEYEDLGNTGNIGRGGFADGIHGMSSLKKRRPDRRAA